MLVLFMFLCLLAFSCAQLQCVTSVTEIGQGEPVQLPDVVIPSGYYKWKLYVPNVCYNTVGVRVKMCDSYAPHLRVNLYKSMIHLKRSRYRLPNGLLSVTVYCQGDVQTPNMELLPIAVKAH